MSHSVALSSCTENVRRFDRDRFLGALLARGEQRKSILGLYAFNLEIARLREQVHEPMMGMIRLQWWRERLDELEAAPQTETHPVLEVLREVKASPGFDVSHLHAILNARESDWEDGGAVDLVAFLRYAEETAGRLNRGVLDTLGIHDPIVRLAVRDLGAAWAIVGLIRAIPFHAGIGRVSLPVDRMMEHGVSAQEILNGRSSPALRKLVAELVEHALYRVAQVRLLQDSLPRAALPLLFQAPQIEAGARMVRRVGCDPFHPRLSAAGPALFGFLKAHLFGFW